MKESDVKKMADMLYYDLQRAMVMELGLYGMKPEWINYICGKVKDAYYKMKMEENRMEETIS